MYHLLAVGCGGFLGASSRYLLSLWINRFDTHGFPLATLLINLTGSFLIGLLSELFSSSDPEQKRLQLFLMTGLLGGFTTFSTFSLETVTLYQAGNSVTALLYLLLSVGCCLIGTVSGKLLAHVVL